MYKGTVYTRIIASVIHEPRRCTTQLVYTDTGHKGFMPGVGCTTQDMLSAAFVCVVAMLNLEGLLTTPDTNVRHLKLHVAV